MSKDYNAHTGRFILNVLVIDIKPGLKSLSALQGFKTVESSLPKSMLGDTSVLNF